MALIKCVDCGNMISDSSEMCVHCGCPTKKSIPIEEFVVVNAALKKYNGNDSNVTIPEGIKVIWEKAFRKCSGSFSNTVPCCYIFNITFPKSLKKINQYAFSGFGLINVDIPEGTEEIGDIAFLNCKRLTKVVLPSTLKIIGEASFNDCDNLERVVINCALSKKIDCFFNRGKEIEKTVFDLRKNSISILDTFQRKALSVACFLENRENGIEYDEKIVKTNLAFIKKRRSDLAKYAMNSVALMKYMIKERLLPLDDAIILSSNTDISSEIKTIVLDYIDSFGEVAKNSILDDNTFTDKNSDYWLKKIWNYKKVKDTATLTFLKEESEVVIVPEQIDGLKVTALAPRCFENRKNVKEIIISNTVTKLGRDLFIECDALEKVVVGEGLTEIKQWIFHNTPIKEIVLPKTVKKLARCAFYGCHNLEKLNLPEGLEIIEKYAFRKCDNLQVYEMPATLKILESEPKNAWNRDNGSIYIKTKNNPYYYLSCASSQDANFRINPNCKVILFRAFSCCKYDILVIPNNIERIDAGAFNQCGKIKKVIIGEKVKNISRRAFEKGSKITIVGKIGSEAEAFAKEAGLIFEPID